MKVGMNRFVAVLLATLLCFMQIGSAFASSTSDQADEGENVGSSLYDITTALTAFASNVVGVNDNANQGNDNQEVGERTHKLTEMAGLDTGDGGAIIGYGDADKGFQPFLASNDTKAMTVSSYSAYMNIGDGGKAYTYARYGRLLQDLGLDEVGNVAQIPTGRTLGGKVLSGMRVVSDLVPDAFSLALKLLNMLNPFWLLTGGEAYNAQSGTASYPSSGNIFQDQMGQQSDPFSSSFTSSVGAGTTPAAITDSRSSNITVGNGGLTATEQQSRETALTKVRDFFTMIYNGFTSIGLLVILPLLFALLIAGILLNRRTAAAPKIVTYLKRAVFIVVGIPMLATLYSAVLNQLQVEALETKPSSRIIAASFVDFESWVTSSRLSLPIGTTLRSNKVSDSEEQGEASGDTWRSVRISAYNVNYATDLYGLPASSGIGFNSLGVDTNAGMFETTGGGTYTGEYAGELVDEAHQAQMRARLNALLTVYSDGRTYTSGAWNSAVMGWAAKNLSDAEMGNLQQTSDASTNKNTFYQMVFDTDQVDDWMNRSIEDNQHIWDGSAGAEEALWAPIAKINIFRNGSSIGGASTTNSNMTFFGSWAHGDKDGVSISKQIGLSTVSMYNYLATHFDQSAIRVYSGAKAVSEFGRMQHYSVNMVGSGVLKVLFGLNCFVCLGVFVVLGIAYCGGVVLHNIKHGFSMLMSIPGAMLGVMKSIAQVLVYFVSMILELFVTIFLYNIVTTFVISFSSAIEGILNPKLAEMAACSVAGGIFGNGNIGSLATQLFDNKLMFTVGMVAVVAGLFVITYGCFKFCRVFHVAYAYVSLRFWRLMTCKAMLPTYDRVVASYPSLYIWDNVKADFGNVFDLLSPEVQVTRREVVQA